MKQKAFFMIFKGLSIKQITRIFLEGESPALMRTTAKGGIHCEIFLLEHLMKY